MILNYLFFLLLVTTLVTSFAKGGRPERIGAAIYAVGCVLTVVFASPKAGRFAQEETGILLVDVVTFLAFFFFAIVVDRFWPIWVTAFLAVPLFGHLAVTLAPDIVPWTYAVILSIWSYPILLIMVVASLRIAATRKPGMR